MGTKTQENSASLEEQANAAIEDETVVDSDELSKALDAAIEELSPTEESSKLKKAKKAMDEDEEEADEEYEEDEDEPEPPKKTLRKKVKKSRDLEDYERLSTPLPEQIESDPEAAEVLDAMPFMKALMYGLEDQTTELIKAVVDVNDRFADLEARIEKRFQELVKSVKSSQKLEIAQANLVKSLYTELKAQGDAPLPRKSVTGNGNLILLKKSGTGDGNQTIQMSPLQALEKATELCREGKLGVEDVSKIEMRLQKGIPLSDAHIQLLTS